MQKDIRTYSNDEALVKERRTHIADTALKLFLKKGYDATTMREISKACKMATGTIYNYIGSKTDILRIMCLQAVEDERGRFEGILNKLDTSGATDCLEGIISAIIHEHDVDQDWVIFLFRQQFLFPREYQRMLISGLTTALDTIKKILIKGVETGEFRIDPSMIILLPMNIYMLGQEWVLRGWYLAEHFTVEEYTKKQTTAILKQIRVDT